MIKIKFTQFVKDSNPDMIPQFEEDEQRDFKTHREVYNFVVGKYGSTGFSFIEMYENEERLSYWKLSIHRKPYTKKVK